MISIDDTAIYSFENYKHIPDEKITTEIIIICIKQGMSLSEVKK